MSDSQVGALIGGAGGAALGSAVPGVGTVVGGVLGTAAGSLLGGLFGNSSAPTPANYDPNAYASLYGVPNQAGLTQQANDLGNTNISVDQSGYNAVNNNQNALAAQLLGVANGTAPSAADIQMQQGLQQGLQQSRAATSAAAGYNPIAALQVQQNAQGASQRQSLGDAASLRATETNNAYTQLGNLYGTQASNALNASGQQLQAQQTNIQAQQAALQGNLNIAGLTQAGNLAMANAYQNSADATRAQSIATTQQNYANSTALTGALLQGLGSVGGGLAKGNNNNNNNNGTPATPAVPTTTTAQPLPQAGNAADDFDG